MTIAIWMQVWATKDEAVAGYPDPEFLAILLEKADAGDARSQLRFAVKQALDRARAESMRLLDERPAGASTPAAAPDRWSGG
jgi:hypothetical protein